MTRSIDPDQWQTHKVKGRIYEVMVSVRGEVVVLGSPKDHDGNDDEDHNCDANGCGQEHVLWRHRP